MRKEVRTFTDDRGDLRWGAAFLGALLAIPVAGLLGLPLLILLLFLFLANPGGLGERLGRCQFLKNIPGFRSAHCGHMAVASLLYLLPISLLGIAVVDVDGLVLRGLLGR
ncbi:MAG: hypothetical protein ABI234_12065 [Ktedonobacteraceae bacterium]